MLRCLLNVIDEMFSNRKTDESEEIRPIIKNKIINLGKLKSYDKDLYFLNLIFIIISLTITTHCYKVI